MSKFFLILIIVTVILAMYCILVRKEVKKGNIFLGLAVFILLICLYANRNKNEIVESSVEDVESIINLDKIDYVNGKTFQYDDGITLYQLDFVTLNPDETIDAYINCWSSDRLDAATTEDFYFIYYPDVIEYNLLGRRAQESYKVKINPNNVFVLVSLERWNGTNYEIILQDVEFVSVKNRY